MSPRGATVADQSTSAGAVRAPRLLLSGALCPGGQTFAGTPVVPSAVAPTAGQSTSASGTVSSNPTEM